MFTRTDPKFLKDNQYKDAHNLNARINLHRQFSTNPQDWFRWVFQQTDLITPANVLELGCGPGMLWKHNLDRITTDFHIYLSDFSPGMILEARLNTSLSSAPIYYMAFDAQAIPFLSSNFDMVIANHMLYHIPNRSRALSEIHRVLKPRGRLLAATNGIGHMKEIRQLLIHLEPNIADQTFYAFGVNEFTTENGTSQLERWFSNIHIIPYEDSLEVTEAEPLLEYILSMNTGFKKNYGSRQINLLLEMINHEIASKGSFHISKSTSLFIAEK